MAAFQVMISPPARKPAVQKRERTEEAVPRLILAPFSPQAEVKFGEVIINSVHSRQLIIFNPSTSISIQFSNIDPDDRISLSDYKINLNPREETLVIVSWSPIHSGYLRKVIRAQDANRKARSFDVILSGMAVNKGIQNQKKKKKNDHHPSFQKTSDATLTLNQTALHDLRRQTYSIEEKENRLPSHLDNSKFTMKTNSPTSDFSNLIVLHENSIITNFSRNCSYDSVDAPAKYSNFEYEFNPSNFINTDISDEINHRRSTFSMDVKETICSPKYSFCDSIEEERASTPSENVTYELEHNENVCMTPLKGISDSFIFSPQEPISSISSVTQTVTTTTTKSVSGLSSVDTSFVSNLPFKTSLRDGLLFISPPAKSVRPARKSNDFIHRTGSSAIKDRRKHLRTSFMSKKKASPKKLLTRRKSTLLNDSTVEKIKSQNSYVLKQVVSSQCHFEDPFLKQLVYNNDQWIDEQEKDIIKWMNSILIPPADCEENVDWTIDGAEAWMKRNYSSNSVWAANKVPITLYNAPEKLDILRKRKQALLENEYVKVVFEELATHISRKIIFVREGRDIYADEGIKNKLLQLLACYNPVWLRMGLEAVYKQEIALQSKADFGGLGLFIRKKVIVTSSFVKKTEQEKEAVRKNILLKFFQLIFFMDQARIHKLIRHNRCLFTLKSKHKTSQSLLADFCADLVSGRGYVMKHLKSIGYILQFKQTCIDEYDYTVVNLKDLNDGVRLTRLFEILFSEPDLCSKLRVPAVDIENKKFNVEVAMKAAKARCTIKGNITAEDFVLATRVGSRLKILSFLWQIIYDYLTPLYEKAAVKIQKWWRKHLSRVHKQQRKKNKSARVIQSAWRKYCIRKQFNDLNLQLLEREKEEKSARIIQSRFKAFLAMKRDRDLYLKKLNAIKLIQLWIRCKIKRRRFLRLKRAAILIQQRYKANKIMDMCRKNFLELRKHVMVVQQRFRANNMMRFQKREFLKLKNACICIQRRFRASKTAKKERQLFLQLKESVILIQRSYRSRQLTKIQRNNYLRMKNFVILMQRHFRARKLMKTERDNYIRTKKATVTIQRYFRNYITMREERKKFSTLKRYAVIVQRRYRANVEMKKQRCFFIRLKETVSIIQKRFRSNQEMKMVRLQYLQLKTSTINIQRRFRAKQLMKIEQHQYMKLKWAAVEIQRQFRAKRAMQLERQKYQKLKWAAILIQKRFRAARAMEIEKDEYASTMKAVLFVQRKFRAKCMMRQKKRKYEAFRKAVVKIQQAYRALQFMRDDREKFLRMKMAAVKIQQRYRALKRMQECRKSYEELRRNTVFVQRQWRMKMSRDRFIRKREAAIKIQRWWLVFLQKNRQIEAPPQVEENSTSEELAAIKIQAAWRGYQIRKKKLIPKRKPSLVQKKDNKDDIDSKSTLEERYLKAIYLMKTSDLYNVILMALWNLERVTTFSAKLCEGVTNEGIVPIIFDLMARGNRSEPSLELYRASISILINLTLYPPTKAILWNNMDKFEDISRIVHIMKITHDKFFRKNDVDVFRYSTTFLWLLCQEEDVAKHITDIPFVRLHLEKMKETLIRRCPCQKITKQKRIPRVLPKTETNWYADSQTRTFDDNCFALLSLYSTLYPS